MNLVGTQRAAAVALCVVVVCASKANAWTRAGHMVTAAIAYDDLVRTNDEGVIARATALLEHHPDRAAFEVAVARTTGDERARRLFYECARWPDDARGTIFDHPTWHYAFRPFVRAQDPPPRTLKESIDGDAFEAIALNERELGNPNAPDGDRALALCWVMHITGDLHQPLHTAQLFSPAFPDGDRAGTLFTVLDPETQTPVTLHWVWDDSAHRSDEPSDVEARARTLEALFPPASLTELATSTGPRSWANESYSFAASAAYPIDIELNTKAPPKSLPAPYVQQARRIAERRVTLAGYRLAEVLRDALRPSDGGHGR